MNAADRKIALIDRLLDRGACYGFVPWPGAGGRREVWVSMVLPSSKLLCKVGGIGGRYEIPASDFTPDPDAFFTCAGDVEEQQAQVAEAFREARKAAAK